jgi:hypothetical protein
VECAVALLDPFGSSESIPHQQSHDRIKRPQTDRSGNQIITFDDLLVLRVVAKYTASLDSLADENLAVEIDGVGLCSALRALRLKDCNTPEGAATRDEVGGHDESCKDVAIVWTKGLKAEVIGMKQRSNMTLYSMTEVACHVAKESSLLFADNSLAVSCPDCGLWPTRVAGDVLVSTIVFLLLFTHRSNLLYTLCYFVQQILVYYICGCFFVLW